MAGSEIRVENASVIASWYLESIFSHLKRPESHVRYLRKLVVTDIFTSDNVCTAFKRGLFIAVH